MSESTVEQSVLDDTGFIERRDELLVAVAEPLVRNVVGRKLARFNSRRGVGRLTPCPDDLTYDVLEELTRSLNTAPPDSPLWETAVFVRYAARAAENWCYDLYRDDLPEGERVRRKVYRALKIHRSFSSWETKGARRVRLRRLARP